MRKGDKQFAQVSMEEYFEEDEAGDEGVSMMYNDVIEWFNHDVINAEA